MGRLCKVLAVLCLLLGATAAPSAPSFARQYDDLAADAAVQAVNALIARINAAAAAAKGHRFAPAYYAPPCTPTKEEGEASLAPYRQQRRALAAEIAAIKARFQALESFSSSALVLANNGWNIRDQNRFRALDQAYRALDRAIADKEAELDRMPVLPCRTAAPPPQPPRDPNGPLTAGEEAQFEDFPLTPPTFDDPVTMPAPPRFCTYAERRAWMDGVYWPTVKRAEANALKAIEAFARAEQRLREVRAADRPDSPRIALAEQSVRYWEAEKNRRMAEHRRLLDIDVPNPVDCGQPTTGAGTTGTPSGTTGGTALGPSTPPAATPTPPAAPPPPLPPGVVRPQLERTTAPRLPARFCSEKEKLDFLVEVYHPAADAASKNALKTSAYRARLSQLIQEAGERGDQAALAALKAEYEAFKPIAEEADALAQRMYRMRDDILRIPVVDCSKSGQTAAAPPPVDETGMAPVVVTAGPIRDAGGDRPRLPPPPLARPQFERVPEIAVPARFCSAYERNDFLNNVYNPAVAAALANARTAQAHQAKLNALFTQYMKANSEHWAAVRAERDAFEAITNEALTRSGALNDLYARIMAVPIVDCGPRTETPPPTTPLTTPPVATPPAAVPSAPPSTGMVPGTGPGPRDFPPFEIRHEFCTREEAEAYLRTVETRLAEVRDERDRLESLIGATINDDLVDAKMPEGWREGLTSDQMRAREAEAFANAGRIALGRAAEGKSGGDLAEYGRAFLAFGQNGVDHLFTYDEEIRRLDSTRRRTIDLIAAGRYAPCPKKPCPPRQGRDPITVGPNSKVGSGAQLRGKLGGMATSALLGALGAGGGGGGGSEPQLWTCKIKESEMTLFEDPVTGVSIRVGARRAKDKVVVFTDIVKSPDKGTFQTAFLERPSTGEVLAPSDVGPCDLWGEWKLTVSWTRSTYVDGQLVKRESGGWSEGGFFRIPGVLSKVDAPDGLWKRMGFSNASHGVRDMAAIFDVPPGGGPLTYVVHVTRPKGDPVTTVPFVLTLTEGPGGVFTVARGADPPCPEERPWDTTSVAAPPVSISDEPPPKPSEIGGSLPPPPPPQALPPWYVDYLPMVQQASDENLRAMRGLIDEADRAPCPDGYKRALDRIRWSMDEFRRMVPKGAGADAMRDVIDEALKRLDQMEDEVLRKMAASRCPSPDPGFKVDEASPPRPAPYTPPPGGASGPRLPFNPPPDRPVSEPAKVDGLAAEAQAADSGLGKALADAARACPADPAGSWTALRNRARAALVARMLFLSSLRPTGPGAQDMTDALGREFNRTMLLLQEINALQPPPCSGMAPDQPPTEEETESILDDIEEKLVIG
ncbi:MAG: hypothetical protein ACOY4K_12735 [Pseudomonadota bacterium]